MAMANSTIKRNEYKPWFKQIIFMPSIVVQINMPYFDTGVCKMANGNNMKWQK